MTNMPTPRAPRDAAVAVVQNPRLPTGDDERFTGFGVMGLPFASGHVLALRDFPATTFAPAYRSVWHRDPAGIWTFYATVPGHLGCTRYFSSATPAPAVECDIDVEWMSPWSLHIRIDELLEWRVDMRRTAATRVMIAVGTRLPERAWTNRAALAVIGRAAGPILGIGRARLHGSASNGQDFMIAPRQMWAVAASHTTLRGEDLGPIGPLPRQARLGDFWVPQRGLFVVGKGHFETFDASRHRSVTQGAQSARDVSLNVVVPVLGLE